MSIGKAAILRGLPRVQALLDVRGQVGGHVGRTILSLLFSQASNAVIGAALWFLAARLYTVTAIGETATLIGISTFVANASLLGLDYTVVRYLPRIDAAEQPGFLGAGFAAGSAVALVLSLAALPVVLSKVPVTSSPQAIAVAVLVVAAGLLVTLGLIGDAVLLALGRPGAILKRNVLASLIRIVLVVAAARLVFQASLYAAYAVSWLCGAILLAVFVCGRSGASGASGATAVTPTARGLHTLARLSPYAGWNYAATMCDTASIQLLPLLILTMTNAHVTGVFAIVWLISSILFIIPSSVGRALFNHQSNATIGARQSAYVARALLAAGLVIAVLVVLFSPWVLAVVGPKYAPGAGALRWFAASLCPIAYSNLRAVRVRVSGQVAWLVVCSAVFLATLFLGVSLLLPRLGLDGVGMAWFGGQAIYAFLITIVSRRAGPLPSV